jgi:Fic family protein
MYLPKFTITNRILMSIGQVEASREVITNAPLVPDFEKEFQTDAVMRTVYHGTHIEGNDLTMLQTKQVLEGENIFGRERDVQEVVNYRNVIKIIDDLGHKRGGYDIASLLEIHATTVYNIIPPHKAGAIRTSQVLIKEEGTGKVILSPPPPYEIAFLLDDFFSWLNSARAQEIHPVLRAGIVHYVLVAIHPFVEGNGRAIRAFTNLVLLREGYDIKRFFSLEEHFDKDLSGYYNAFAEVDKMSSNIVERDLTVWLEYFSQTVAIEMAKIKEKVKKLSIDSRMRLKIGEQVALSARQIKLIEYLNEKGSGVMRDLRAVHPMVSEDTILRDLKALVDKGIVDKEGSTKAARYVIKTKT